MQLWAIGALFVSRFCGLDCGQHSQARTTVVAFNARDPHMIGLLGAERIVPVTKHDLLL